MTCRRPPRRWLGPGACTLLQRDGPRMSEACNFYFALMRVDTGRLERVVGELGQDFARIDDQAWPAET